MMFSRIFLLLGLLLGGGVQASLEAASVSTGITTRAYHSWKDSYRGKSFWVFPFDNTHENNNPFMQLGPVVQHRLQAQGLRHHSSPYGKPNFVVFLAYGYAANSSGDELGYPRFRMEGPMPFIADTSGQPRRPKYYRGMQTSSWRSDKISDKRGGPHHGLVVYVAIVEMDWQRPARSKVVWQGEAVGTHSRSLLGQERKLINTLFQNFPAKPKEKYHWKW